MKLTKKIRSKLIEGLGILLMILGISSSSINWESTFDLKYIFYMAITIGGWLSYSFSDKIR